MAATVTLPIPMDSFPVPGIFHRYHAYQQIWTPFVEGKATIARELGSEHDCYVVAMLKDENFVYGWASAT